MTTKRSSLFCTQAGFLSLTTSLISALQISEAKVSADYADYADSRTQEQEQQARVEQKDRARGLVLLLPAPASCLLLSAKSVICGWSLISPSTNPEPPVEHKYRDLQA
jgi:hypothetical protein